MSIIPTSRPQASQSQIRALLKARGVSSPVALVAVRGYYSETFAPAGNSSRFCMALFAHRNYIEPMLHIIAQMMMILGSRFAALTAQKSADVWHFALSNSIVDFAAGFVAFWVKRAKSPHLFYAMFLVVLFGYFGIIGAIPCINLSVGFGVSFAPIQNSLLVIFFVSLVIIAACLKPLFLVFSNVSLRSGAVTFLATR